MSKRIFTVILLIQAMLLLNDIYESMTNEYASFDIDINSFAGDAQLAGDAGNVQILAEQNSGEKYILSDSFSVGSGCYRIMIDYDAAKYPGQAPSYKDAAGYVYLQTNLNKKALISDSIYLDDAAHKTEENFWVRSGVTLDNARVGVKYLGSGDITIRGIHIEECGRYRATRILGWLVVFAFLDWICIYLARPAEELTERGKRRRENVFAVGVLTLFASLPCFADFLYNGHDLGFHLQRIAEVAHELSYGQFPVRMMTEMANGYSYANPLFYCDIFLYIPAILFNCLVPLQTCYQIYVVCVNLATAWIAFYSFERIASDRYIGFGGACVYMLAAYRFTNLYVRAAVGEYTAMAFMPLVALGIYEIYREERPVMRNWLPLALGMSGIVSCHILSLEMTAIFLVILGLLCAGKTFRAQRISAVVKAALLSFALTAWFMIPLLDMLLSFKVRVSDTIYDLQSDGTYWLQLFGGMMTSGGDSHEWTKGEGPFTLGWGLVLGLLLMGVVLMYGRVKDSEDTLERGALKKVLFLSGLAICFTTYSFPWDSFEQWFGESAARFFGRVQYPWRYLSIASILISVGIVLALKLLAAKSRSGAYISAACLGAVSLLVIGNFYLNYMNSSDMSVHASVGLFDTHNVSGREYFPAGTDTYYVNRINYAECGEANLSLVNFYKESGKAYLTCENHSESRVQVIVPIFNYPNYEASDELTGSPIMIIRNGLNNNNRMALDIPIGYSGTVVIRYCPPFLWRAAELVSWLTLTGGLAFAVYVRKNRAQNPQKTC